MKSSFLPKYEQKIVRISALCNEVRDLRRPTQQACKGRRAYLAVKVEDKKEYQSLNYPLFMLRHVDIK